ncbi:MAG: alpha/beta hydrolase [Sphingomonadales bacterium]|nr:alpha/beta hydrolase [Sphingomonadales bacterium]MBD3774224.1 alpha/beta hydrolase [Paracoccaceae bacterium]
MILAGPMSQSFVSQRLRLHYVDWGNRGAPPLLLVHGGRDHCRSWDWVAEELRADWHVIAFDHRGHGDSEWVNDGNYLTSDMVYDLAQLVHQLDLAPVTILAHSMGGDVSLRYAAAFPDMVAKLAAIEPVGLSPEMQPGASGEPYVERVRKWVEGKREAAGRLPRRYATVDEALARMIEANRYLSEEQARHLTYHGVNRNEDGSFSWKFDPYLHNWPVDTTPHALLEQAWAAITCPTLLFYGAESWATDRVETGWIEHFQDARMVKFENAGHWLHHDQFDRFMAELRGFL